MNLGSITERAQRIREAISALSVEVTSEDHAVTAVVGPGGAVLDLSLSSRAFRHNGTELGEIIVQTIQEANAQLRSELSATLADLAGGIPHLSSGLFGALPTPSELRAECGASASASAQRTTPTRPPKVPQPPQQQAGPPRSRSPHDFQHPDDVLAFIEDIRERNQRTIDRYEEYVEQLKGLTAEGFAGDGQIRVQVDENGIVSHIDIDDKALRWGSRLATMVISAAKEAQAAQALRMAALGEQLSHGSVMAMVRETIPDHILDTVEQRQNRKTGW